MSLPTQAQRDKLIKQGLTPFYWGTGVTINKKDAKNMTVQEALDAADLDFTVVLGKGTADWQDAKGKRRSTRAQGKFYTVRQDTGDILGAVGNRYHILQNRDAFNFASDIIDGKTAAISAVGSVKNGARTFVVCDLMGTGMTVNGIEEGVVPKLVLMNDHQGNQSVTGFITMERIWCHNMLNYAMKGAENVFRVRHTATMEDKLAVQSGREALKLVVEYTAEFEKAMAKLLKQKVTKKQAIEFINRLVPLPDEDEDSSGKAHRGITVAENKREGMLDVYFNADNLANIRGTRYGLQNAVSEYYQHHTEGRNTRAVDEADIERVKAENRFDRLLSGQGIDHESFALLMG